MPSASFRLPILLLARRLAAALLCLAGLTSAQAMAQDAIASVLVGAGHIAGCDSRGDEETARLLDRIPGAVFTTGDNVYDRGTIQEFVECFGPSWGRHKSRIRPAAGNHDYLTRGARGYFTYFGFTAPFAPAGAAVLYLRTSA